MRLGGSDGWPLDPHDTIFPLPVATPLLRCLSRSETHQLFDLFRWSLAPVVFSPGHFVDVVTNVVWRDPVNLADDESADPGEEALRLVVADPSVGGELATVVHRAVPVALGELCVGTELIGVDGGANSHMPL